METAVAAAAASYIKGILSNCFRLLDDRASMSLALHMTF